MTRHRGGNRVSPLKHETPLDREQRHRKAVIDAGMTKPKPQPLPKHVQGGFDVTAWDKMHREAEEATLMYHAGEI